MERLSKADSSILNAGRRREGGRKKAKAGTEIRTSRDQASNEGMTVRFRHYAGPSPGRMNPGSTWPAQGFTAAMSLCL